MLRQLSRFLIVAVTLFATTAPCFCWTQVLSQPSCHAVEMKDCCCSTEAAMDHEEPVTNPALLPSTWHVPDLQVAALVVAELDFEPSSVVSLFGHRDRWGPLRAPPDLYLLHASFLI